MSIVYTPKDEEERATVVRNLEHAREVGDTIGIMIAMMQLQQYAEDQVVTCFSAECSVDLPCDMCVKATLHSIRHEEVSK